MKPIDQTKFGKDEGKMTFEDEYKRAFPGPYEYYEEGGLICDKDGNLILDVRGIGRLLGKGVGGLGMDDGKGMAVLDWFGNWLADTLNSRLPPINT